MKNKKILSYIDVINRDLNFNFVIKYLIEQNSNINFDVKHQDIQNSFYKSSYFDEIQNNYDLLLTPSYNVRRMESTYSRAWHFKTNIVHTHSEPLSESVLFEEKLNLSNLSQYNEEVQYHIVWSDYFAELLVKVAKVSPEKIYKVNNIRYEIIDKMSRKNIIKDIDYLFISDFSIADFTEEQFMVHKKTYNIPDWVDYRSLAIEARNKFVNIIDKAASENKDKKFVIRMHPGEKIDFYKKYEKENIEINFVGDISDLIIQSKIAFGYTSTTLFECIAANVMMYNIKLVEVPKFLDQEVYNYYNWIDESKVLKICKNPEKYISKKYSDEIYNKYEYFVGKMRDNYASLKYCLALEDILKNPNKKFLPFKFKVLKQDFLHILKDISLKLSCMIFDYMKLKTPIYKLAKNNKLAELKEDDYLSVENIQNKYFRFLNDMNINLGYDEKLDYKVIQKKYCKEIYINGEK